MTYFHMSDHTCFLLLTIFFKLFYRYFAKFSFDKNRKSLQKIILINFLHDKQDKTKFYCKGKK